MPVLLLIDTAGCGMEERVEEEGDSKSNDGEAQVCPFSGPVLFVWPHLRIIAGADVCKLQGLVLLRCLQATRSLVSPLLQPAWSRLQ